MIETKDTIDVLIVTYNQQQYISEAIDSILKQEINVPIRIIVADDCSTDETARICKDYEEKTQGTVRLLRRENNLGLIKNFTLALFDECDGDYIALCAGDDFWPDQHKLQRQYDYLRSHKDVSVVHTGFRRVYDDGTSEEVNRWDSPLLNTMGKDAVIHIVNRNFSSFPVGSSMLFRGQEIIELLKQRKDLFVDKDIPGEAMFLFPALSELGKFAFIPDIMTAYRIRKGSLSHISTEEKEYIFKLRYYVQIMDTSHYYQISFKPRIRQALRLIVLYFQASRAGFAVSIVNKSRDFILPVYCRLIRNTLKTIIYIDDHRFVSAVCEKLVPIWHHRLIIK